MKCTIESVRNIEFGNQRNGARVEGFIPMPDTSIIPENIRKWIFYYEGIKAIVYEDGIFVASWAETICSEKDKYDSAIGAHIAESKAKAKIYRFMRNFADSMSNYFESLSNEFQDMYLKYDHCVDHEEDHSAKLGNKYND